jgi:hypothetical protein
MSRSLPPRLAAGAGENRNRLHTWSVRQDLQPLTEHVRLRMYVPSQGAIEQPATSTPDEPRDAMTQQSQAPIVERAYQLARSGKVSGVGEILAALKKEGYRVAEINTNFEGRTIRRALAALCKHEAAKKEKR